MDSPVIPDSKPPVANKRSGTRRRDHRKKQAAPGTLVDGSQTVVASDVKVDAAPGSLHTSHETSVHQRQGLPRDRPAFKPLNFAPPTFTSSKSKAPQRPPSSSTGVKQGGVPANVSQDITDAIQRNVATSKKARKPRPKPKPKHIEQSDTTSAMRQQVKVETGSQKSTKPPLFHEAVDPFPNVSDSLIQATQALTVQERDLNLSRVPHRRHSSTKSKRDVSPMENRRNDSPSTSRREASQSADKRDGAAASRSTRDQPQQTQAVKPKGRVRKPRAQLPSSILNGSNVTRGPHGRFLFASPAQDYSTSVGSEPADLSNQSDVKLIASESPPFERHAKSEQKSWLPYYTEHISLEEAQAGLKDGRYLRGLVRIGQKNRSEAYVSVKNAEVVDHEAVIIGDKQRNRALNGDEAVIEIIRDGPGDRQSGEQGLTVNDLKHTDRTKARVVYILNQRPLQRISGFIRPSSYVYGLKEQNIPSIIKTDTVKNFCVFHPQDQRIPWITIPRRSLPKELQGPNWIFNILQAQKTIYAARIQDWQAQNRQPRGIIVEELGTVGNINAETAAILADCDVDVRDHPTSALQCLPSTPWSISAEEISKRRDFRKDRVCTIDPETARDLDDALSVRKLDDGNYEIGVHIADVSHFIEQGNALDKIARDRATTVYMVQRAIPMLPRLLCEELCSLNPAVDRLAFSVTWTMNEEGEEVGPRWYGRSIIRSAVRFAYGEAQNLLDGQSWSEGVGKPIDGGHSEEAITQDIKVLLKMSKAMRAKRFENGALTINAFKLNFKLEKDGLPGVAEVYQLRDANRLIEEFMLKANISVAEKISSTFPEHALLRCHPPPKERPLKEFVNYALKLGITIDAASSSSLQASFNQLAALSHEDPMVGILQNNAVRSMQKAIYMCTGLHEDPDEWAHYALAVPLYTHFTSPIRRYADVVVHRLLDRALQHQLAGFEADDCEAWAANCNVRKENARLAQDRSSLLYLCAYIEEHCRKNGLTGTDTGMLVDAVVISVKDRSLDIVVPGMAIEKRIYYEDAYAVDKFVFNADRERVSITWRTEEERQSAIAKAENAADDALLKPTRGSSQDESSANSSATTEGTSGASRETSDATTDNRRTPRDIVAMDKIKVWLRGDFQVSPCQVVAGLISPL